MDEKEIRAFVKNKVDQVLGSRAEKEAPTDCDVKIGKVLSQETIRQTPRGRTLRIGPGVVVTPSARETALIRRVTIVSCDGSNQGVISVLTDAPSPPGRVAAPAERTVAIGADHGGVEMKDDLKGFIQGLGYQVIDCGTFGTASVDYPDFAYAVAKIVSEAKACRGIVVDGAGIGSCMTANKVPGVRAALCYDCSSASNAREHNDANVLTLGGKLIGKNLSEQIVRLFLETPFGGGRHGARVDKIMAVEKRFLSGAVSS